MKKLLTLGVVGTTIVPMAAVIACSDESKNLSDSYNPETKTLTFQGWSMDSNNDDIVRDDLIALLSNSQFTNATTVIIQGKYGNYDYEGSIDITKIVVDGTSFINLGELLNSPVENIWLELFNASEADYTSISKDIKDELSFISYFDDASGWVSGDIAYNAEDANDLYGIMGSEFEKIEWALGDEWLFEELMLSSDDVGTKTLLTFSSAKQPHRGNFTPVELVDKVTFEPQLNRNLIINGVEFKTDEDKFIMVDDYYFDGELWSGNKYTGEKNTDGYSELVRGSYWGAEQGVAQIAKGDSVIAIYDEDDNDGYNISNFEDSVAFIDTSMSSDADISKINSELGNGVSGTDSYGTSILMFKNGKLLPYFGGQSNHMNPNLDFQGALKIMALQVEVYQLEAVLAYYGYMNQLDDNGDYMKDPNILNGASTGFLPFIADEGMFTYQKIAKNAIKITYNVDSYTLGLPAAQFAFTKPINGTENGYETSTFGKFSYGFNSWKAYEEGAMDYTFTARKDIYI